jgi:hypothetical protein
MAEQNELGIATAGEDPDSEDIIDYLSRLHSGHNNNAPERETQNLSINLRIKYRQKKTHTYESNCEN